MTIALDFALWSVDDFIKFSNNGMEHPELADKIIVDAPYEGVLEDQDMILVLQVYATIGKQAVALLSGAEPVDGVSVDVKKWKFKQFRAFSKALQELDLDYLSELLSVVLVKHPFGKEFSLVKLDFETFAGLFSMVQKAIKEGFEAKN